MMGGSGDMHENPSSRTKKKMGMEVHDGLEQAGVVRLREGLVGVLVRWAAV